MALTKNPSYHKRERHLSFTSTGCTLLFMSFTVSWLKSLPHCILSGGRWVSSIEMCGRFHDNSSFLSIHSESNFLSKSPKLSIGSSITENSTAAVLEIGLMKLMWQSLAGGGKVFDGSPQQSCWIVCLPGRDEVPVQGMLQLHHDRWIKLQLHQVVGNLKVKVERVDVQN